MATWLLAGANPVHFGAYSLWKNAGGLRGGRIYFHYRGPGYTRGFVGYGGWSSEASPLRVAPMQSLSGQRHHPLEQMGAWEYWEVGAFPMDLRLVREAWLRLCVWVSPIDGAAVVEKMCSLFEKSGEGGGK